MQIRTFLKPAIFGLFFCLAAAACTQGGSAPGFAVPDDGPAPNASAPSVQKTLAKEAGLEYLVYHVGPIDLPIGTTPAESLIKPLTMRFQTDKAVWVTGFVPKVIDSNGNELPAGLLHEAMMFNMHEENSLCNGNPNAFAMATSMLTEMKFPDGYGYPILPSDPLEAKAVLVNETDKDYADVFFEIAITTKPMNEFSEMMDLRPMLLELDPCKHAPMEVEPNSFVERSATYQVPVDAKLVTAQGAIQEYGAAVQLTGGGEIVPFWRAEAISDEGHRVTALTDNPFEDLKGVEFKAGDRITIGVSYNNTSDSWLDGATAAAIVYFAPK